MGKIYLSGHRRGIEDFSGKRFGKLAVLEFDSIDRTGHTNWLCLCDCGNRKVIAGKNLVSGTSSCGCIAKVHGRTSSRGDNRIYRVWAAMIQRCCNQSNKGYKIYGARGIGVCERWRKSFVAFLEDMGERPSDQHSIERIDNNKGYEPTNCRWATAYEQRRNTRQNHWIEFAGKRMVLSDWAIKLGVKRATLEGRIRRGWPISDVLMNPIWEPGKPRKSPRKLH